MNNSKADIYSYKCNSLHLNYKTALDNIIRRVRFPRSGKKPLEINSPPKTWDLDKEKQITTTKKLRAMKEERCRGRS